MRDDTDWHMHYPEPGDRFYEFHNTYIEVTDVSTAGVGVMEFLPQPRLRYYRDAKEFREAYRRGNDDYIVSYRGNRREH